MSSIADCQTYSTDIIIVYKKTFKARHHKIGQMCNEIFNPEEILHRSEARYNATTLAKNGHERRSKCCDSTSA